MTLTLTPSHYLTLNPKLGIPTCDIDDNDHDFSPHESSTDKLLVKWKKGLKLVHKFWKVWKDEYLLSLRERIQTRLRKAKIRSRYPSQIGDVVLIKDDLPRGTWRNGKIIELMISYDETEQSHGPTDDKYSIQATDETLRQRPKRAAAQKALKQIRKAKIKR